MTGRLALDCALRDGRSRVTHVRYEGLSRVSRARRAGDAVEVVLAQLGPGIIGGDAYASDVRVAAGASLVLTGQMATPVYARDGAASATRARWRVAPGGSLVVRAEPLMLDDGARHDAYAEIDVAGDGSAVVAEIVRCAPGALARLRTSVRIDGRLVARDACDLRGGAAAIATLFVVCADDEARAEAAALLAPIVAAAPGVRAGTGATGGAVVLRASGDRVWALQRLVHAALAALTALQGRRKASRGGMLNRRGMQESAPFISVIRDVVAARSTALAVDELSYAELWRQTGRVAKRLADRGIVRGERVAIFSENRRGFVLAYLACLRLGAIAVPTNVLYRAADFGNILSDAEPRLVVGSAQTRPHVPAAVPFVDAAEIEAWALDPVHDFDPPIVVGADDVAIIIYTSGTTGRAKGAMITHGNLAAIARQIGSAWRWTSDDTLLLTLPLFHVHGLGAGLNGTLAAGARAILRERFDVNDVAAQLQSGAVTMFFGVPTMYVRFLEKLPPQTFDRMRLFVSGSAALPADVHVAFERQFGASILERYGSTEFGFPLGNRYDGPRVVGSVGVPMSDDNSVTIVAPGTTDRVPDGDVGELLVAGPNVSAGYWRRPDATADAYIMLDGRRWFRSGDLFRFDPERGVYVVMGRLKELIISGGFNIYPLEVEAEMRLQPGVRDVALCALPDAARGELPVAFVEAESDFDSEEFLRALRERLASFKVPKAVHVVDALPRNAMGKVEKQRLIATFAAPAGAGTA